MRSSGVFTVARKEFLDHVSSKKIFLILSIFLLISCMGILSGIHDYRQALDSYKASQSPIVQSDMKSDLIQQPSIMIVFGKIAEAIIFLGPILGIAVGFNLITKEKENRSLKVLLSHPIYRDEVINGKAVGGLTTIGFGLGIAFVLAIAALLLFGIVPDFGDSIRILLFLFASFIFILTYFSISLLLSTISPGSGESLIYSLIVLIFLSVLFQIISSGVVVNAVLGEPPVPPHGDSFNNGLNRFGPEVEPSTTVLDEEWSSYTENSRLYWERRYAFDEALSLFSPAMNYNAIAQQLSQQGIPPEKSDNLQEKKAGFDINSGEDLENFDVIKFLSQSGKNIIVIFIFPAVVFALAYKKFMNMDIR